MEKRDKEKMFARKQEASTRERREREIRHENNAKEIQLKESQNTNQVSKKSLTAKGKESIWEIIKKRRERKE